MSYQYAEKVSGSSKDVEVKAESEKGVALLKTMICNGIKAAELVADKDVVVFIGATGAGKSTTITYLMGAEFSTTKKVGKLVVMPSKLKEEEDSRTKKKYLVDLEGRKYPLIGHRPAESQTLYPEIFSSGSIFFCDCPGFFDTRGQEERIAVAINMELAMKSARTARIAVTVKYEDLTARRGAVLTDLSKLLSKIFSRPSEAVSSIIWIITNTPKETTKEDIIDTLTNVEDGYLATLKRGLTNIENTIRNVLKGQILTAITNFGKAATGAEQFIEEARQNGRQQEIIEAMANPDNLFLINVLTDESRNEILKSIKSKRGIHPDQFNFDGDDDRLKFKTFIHTYTDEALKLFSEKERVVREIEDSKRLLEQNRIRLSSYEATKNAADQKAALQTLQSEWFESYQLDITTNRRRIDKMEAEQTKLRKELAELDTDEEVVLWTSSFAEDNTRWFSYTNHPFNYNDEPFELPVKKIVEEGVLSKEQVDSKAGIYKATLTTGYHEKAKAKIELVTKKKKKRDNALRISQIKAELKQLEEEVERLEQKNEKLKKKQLEFNTKKPVDKVDFDQEKAKIIQEQEEQTKLRIEKEKEFQGIMRRLNENAPLYVAIYEIASVLQAPFIQESELVKNFLRQYKIHIGVERLSDFQTRSFEDGAIEKITKDKFEPKKMLLYPRLIEGSDSIASRYEVDVPDDGTCLFYAVSFAYLIPVIDDPAQFRTRYINLFGSEVAASAEENRVILKGYDGSVEFIKKLTGIFEVLVNVNFRKNVVDYMRQKKKEYVENFASEEVFLAHLTYMGDPKNRAWGDQPEIKAMCEMLQANIILYAHDAQDKPKPMPGYNHGLSFQDSCKLHLVYTAADGDRRAKNHYHYLIEERLWRCLTPSVAPILTQFAASQTRSQPLAAAEAIAEVGTERKSERIVFS